MRDRAVWLVGILPGMLGLPVVHTGTRVQRALLLKLSRQALAAFGAASVDNAAATNSSHACAETVTALANNFAGLISAFHWKNPM